jgi:uncharacterized RDD family membrane protein YckC
MNKDYALASLRRRCAAYGLDIVVALAGILVLQAVLYAVNPLLRGNSPPSSAALHAWVTLTVTLPIATVFGLSWASVSGATPGMRFLRLRVRTPSGDRVSRAHALIRALVLLVPFELNHAVLFYPQPIWSSELPGFRAGFLAVYGLVLTYLVVTWRMPMRQGPHDLAAGTIVIQN